MFNLKILCSTGALLLCAGYAQGMSPDSSFNSSLTRRNSLPVSSRDWKDVALQLQNQLVQKDAKIAGLQQQLKGKDFLEKNFEEERRSKNPYGKDAVSKLYEFCSKNRLGIDISDLNFEYEINGEYFNCILTVKGKRYNENLSFKSKIDAKNEIAGIVLAELMEANSNKSNEKLLHKFCELKNLNDVKFDYDTDNSGNFKYTVTIDGVKYDNQLFYKSEEVAKEEIARLALNELMKVQGNTNSSDNANVTLLCEFYEPRNLTDIGFSYDTDNSGNYKCTVIMDGVKYDNQLFYKSRKVAKEESARFALNELMKDQNDANSSENSAVTLLRKFCESKNLNDIRFKPIGNSHDYKCTVTINGRKYDNHISYESHEVAKEEIARFALNELMKNQNNANSSKNSAVTLLRKFCESKNLNDVKFDQDISRPGYFKYTVTINGRKYDDQLFYKSKKVAKREVARFALNELMKAETNANSSDNTAETLLREFCESKNLNDIKFDQDTGRPGYFKYTVTINGRKYDDPFSYKSKKVAKEEIARFALNELMRDRNIANSPENTALALLYEFCESKNLNDVKFDYDMENGGYFKYTVTIDGVKYDNQLSHITKKIAKEEIAHFALKELMKTQNIANDDPTNQNNAVEGGSSNQSASSDSGFSDSDSSSQSSSSDFFDSDSD